MEGYDFSRAVRAAKISRALAPEVALPLTEILRDYMPDSNEKFVGKDIVRTAWRHAEGGRNVHPLSDLLSQVSNKVERNSLSGKFRPARMA